jgi:hypothetical protein
MMTNQSSGRLVAILRWTIPASLLLACSSDCIYYPCPSPEAAEITVTASSGTAGISGLALAISGAVVGTTPCQQSSGGASVCYISGGPGSYEAVLTAPGYQTVDIKFTVTGTAAGCNTCGHVDRQLLSVVMLPVGTSLGDTNQRSQPATSNER